MWGFVYNPSTINTAAIFLGLHAQSVLGLLSITTSWLISDREDNETVEGRQAIFQGTWTYLIFR